MVASDAGEDNSLKGNSGWADAMQKILNANKPKRKRTAVLAKAKKLNDIRKKIVETENLKEGAIINGVKEKKKDHIPEEHIKKQRRKEACLGIRIKPSILDREREKLLQKIATKGVVQLFNAVRDQQVEIDEKLVKAGPLERKKEDVLKSIDKRSFLDVLMGGSKSISIDTDSKKSIKPENKDDKIWSVLRDDFVMGAKLKDWDKNDENSDSSAPEDMDSD
ncbi:RRP15-like protein [Prorops nasuta]|uniref:RRP15-like protein n=1 Tax=Prorops nasuta TaxID=863751 RepID=UPI0034CD0909